MHFTPFSVYTKMRCLNNHQLMTANIKLCIVVSLTDRRLKSSVVSEFASQVDPFYYSLLHKQFITRVPIDGELAIPAFE